MDPIPDGTFRDRLGLPREPHWLPTPRFAVPAFAKFAALRYRRSARSKLRAIFGGPRDQKQ